MKISFNWLRQFIPFTESPDEISVLLTGCGLEVEQLSQWESMRGGLKGVVIGKVLTCVRHPNADRLNLTTVDTGEGEPRLIVCGAPNIAAGQTVVVALPGTTLYPLSGESFEIKKSKIRGEISDGMICAEDEIGLGESHAGVIVLPDELKAGTPASDYFSVSTDHIFEIGLTPNRADATSHLGVARDLKALLRDKNAELTLPDIRSFKNGSVTSPVKVSIADNASCPRYSGLYISGVKIDESPDWLKARLKSIGIRPVNNIVDITNYVMHDLGQPLHAFDAAAIKTGKIEVKTLPAGTRFITLDGEERKLSGIELMITDGDTGLCIAGVFGGKDSGVNNTTTDIFLESACFNPVIVRKGARAQGLHTDSSFRFERGTDIEMTIVALKRAALMIREIAGGEFSADVIDIYPDPQPWNRVEMSYNFINELAGIDIDSMTIVGILSSLEFKIVSTSPHLIVEVPPCKVEVTRPADVVEEILRIYGYNAIALPKKLSFSQSPVIRPDLWETENKLSEYLLANGFNEIMTNSLVASRNSELLPPAHGEAVQVLNPLSSDLDILRQSMMISGLDAIAYNLNRQQKELRFFESGRTYSCHGGKYIEEQWLSLFMTGARYSRSWNHASKEYDVFAIKAVLEGLLQTTGINRPYSLSETAENGFQQAISYVIKKKTLITFGKVSRAILKAKDISQDVWYAQVNMNTLLSLIDISDKVVPPPPKFPEVRRDLSMLLDKQVKFEEIEKIAYKTEPVLLKSLVLFDVYESEKTGNRKSYAISFLLRDDQATLQDKQIDGIMDKMMTQLEKNLGAEIRRQ